MSADGADVLVVGAGPTGLVLASELQRRHVRYRLIDELPAPATISKAAGVQARTMEVWDSMGFAETVLPQTRVVRGVNVFSAGKRVAHIAIDGIDSPYPHVYGISQHDVEALLTVHLSRGGSSPGGPIERGVRLESFVQDDGGVSSTLTLPDGKTEVFRTRWIVGCDGAHSRVRHSLGFPFEGASYEERLIQADVHLEMPLFGIDDEIVVVLGEGTLMALFPLFRDGRYRLVIMGGEEGETENPTLDVFQRALDTRMPGARVTDPAWMVGFRIHHRHVDRYHEGRAFIAGDACHIHSPVGGQGMNTGIQDAFNLGWKLALVAHGRARPSLLDSYGVERLPIARELVGRTDTAMSAIEGAIKFHHPVGVGVRNSLMSFVTRLNFVHDKATRTLSMLEQNYRAGPLSAQDRSSLWGADVGDWALFGHGPAPGERAPDAPIAATDGGESTVHRLFRGSSFHLLLFTGPGTGIPSRILETAARVHARVGDDVAIHLVIAAAGQGSDLPPDLDMLLDPNGALHQKYGARSECLYLLRPDGYVAYRSHPIDGDKLLAYLDRIFLPRGTPA